MHEVVSHLFPNKPQKLFLEKQHFLFIEQTDFQTLFTIQQITD